MRLGCLARAEARGVQRYARTGGCGQRRTTRSGRAGVLGARWGAEACSATRAPEVVGSVVRLRSGRAGVLGARWGAEACSATRAPEVVGSVVRLRSGRAGVLGARWGRRGVQRYARTGGCGQRRTTPLGADWGCLARVGVLGVLRFACRLWAALLYSLRGGGSVASDVAARGDAALSPVGTGADGCVARLLELHHLLKSTES